MIAILPRNRPFFSSRLRNKNTDHVFSDFHKTTTYSKLAEHLQIAPNVTERLTEGREQSPETYVAKGQGAIDAFEKAFNE